MSGRKFLKLNSGLSIRTELKQKAVSIGGIILMSLIGIFVLQTQEDLEGMRIPANPLNKTGIVVASGPEAETIMIEFMIAGDRDMALQILDENNNEVMSRLYTPAPYPQQIKLSSQFLGKGKFKARIYNHREIIVSEFEV